MLNWRDSRLSTLTPTATAVLEPSRLSTWRDRVRENCSVTVSPSLPVSSTCSLVALNSLMS